MRGTNTGPFGALPPTGRVIELAGADFLTTDHGKLRSVAGYFDCGAIPRQLGCRFWSNRTLPARSGSATAFRCRPAR